MALGQLATTCKNKQEEKHRKRSSLGGTYASSHAILVSGTTTPWERESSSVSPVRTGPWVCSFWEARWAATSEAEATWVCRRDDPSPLCSASSWARAFCKKVTLWASLLTRAGSASAATSLGVFAALARGRPWVVCLRLRSLLRCLAQPQQARRPHCCNNVFVRPAMSSNDKVKPAAPWGCACGGGVGEAASLAAFNSESAAVFSSRASRKDSSAWRSASLPFATLAAALRFFPKAESNQAPGWRGSLRSFLSWSSWGCRSSRRGSLGSSVARRVPTCRLSGF